MAGQILLNERASAPASPPTGYSSIYVKQDGLFYIKDDQGVEHTWHGDTGPTGPAGPTGPTGVAGLVWQGIWSSGTLYQINDAVSYAGFSYICIAQSLNNTPPNAIYWNILAGADINTLVPYTGATADLDLGAKNLTTTGTFNKVTVTQPASGSTLTITNGKTLTASNTLTLTATDGSTLAIGTGGTLGTAAYTASTAYDVAGAAAAVTPTTLGLVIGTNVQAYDADLTSWAGITPGTGVGTALAVAVGSAGAIVTNGGALGSPSSAGTMPAFTLGGAITGGGNNVSGLGTVGATTGTFSGNLAIAGAAQLAYSALNITTSSLSGATENYTINIAPTFQSGTTSAGDGLHIGGATAAAAFTMASLRGIYIGDAIKGAGSTITNQYGIYITDQTKGATNYAIYTNAGGVHFGGNTDVTGTLSATGKGAIGGAVTAYDFTVNGGSGNVYQQLVTTGATNFASTLYTTGDGTWFVGTDDTYKFNIGTGTDPSAAPILRITSGVGAAVTGTLSATGQITASGNLKINGVLLARADGGGILFYSNAASEIATMSDAGIFSLDNTTDATSTTAASLKTAGGIAAVKAIIGLSVKGIKSGSVTNVANISEGATTSVAQNQSFTFTTASNSVIVLVSDNTTGASAIFASGYDGSTITALHNPGAVWVLSATPSAGEIGISKSNNNTIWTIKNAIAATHNISVSVVGSSITSVTDPA